MRFLLLLIASILFASELKIAAAANLKGVLPHIIEDFNKIHPNVKIDVVYGSSGELKEKILKDHNFDLFLTANKYFPKEIQKKGKLTEPKIYAKGILTVVSRKKIKYNNLRELLLNVNCIVIANPSKAPYGKAAVEAINNLWILSEVETKLIFAKNVADVLPHLKECDIGIISKSLKEKLKGKKLYFLDIPPTTYYPIEQSAIILSNKKEAKEFFDFLFSDAAKKEFQRFGYFTE